MISGMKPLIAALAEIKSTELAEDLPDKIEVSGADNVPRCILFNGENNYEQTSTPMDVKQGVLKIAEVILICKTSEVDALELLVVQKLLGYKHSDQHDGVNAHKSWNHKIDGHYTSRRIQFTSMTNVFQQYP